MIRRIFELDLFRFGLVSVLGLGVDLLVAASLAVFVGVPLAAAAFLGFVGGAGANYVLHEFWTFGSRTARPSFRRFAQYMAALVATLVVRIAAVLFLERFVFADPEQKLPTLLVATAASFGVNYLFSKYVVFRPERSHTPDCKPQ